MINFEEMLIYGVLLTVFIVVNFTICNMIKIVLTKNFNKGNDVEEKFLEQIMEFIGGHLPPLDQYK